MHHVERREEGKMLERKKEACKGKGRGYGRGRVKGDVRKEEKLLRQKGKKGGRRKEWKQH